MTDAPAPHPIVLEAMLKEKVWGGRRLERFGKEIPEGARIGESWGLADLGATSASGGGGGEARSVIASGPLGGRTVHDAMELWGADLLGDARPSDDGGLPILVKYLDAREHLSVQVHPSPAHAAANPGAHLKTESWVILDADPGAELFIGLKEGTTRDDLRAAIDTQSVPELLNRVPALVGACCTLPSGTVHALGAGVVVAEVQTPSDTTYRVYDWSREYAREGRELHIDEAIACASTGAAPDPAPAPGAPRGMHNALERVTSAHTDFYTIESVRASCAEVAIAHDTGAPVVVMLTRSMGASLASRSGAFAETELSAGRTALVPASLARDTVLRAGPGTDAILARVL